MLESSVRGEERVKSPSRHLHNVPVQLTSFVGREDELVRARDLLGGTRLLTLTGAGGAGKTRLALEVAARLAHEGRYPGGVWLVELATLGGRARGDRAGGRGLTNKQIAEMLVIAEGT